MNIANETKSTSRESGTKSSLMSKQIGTEGKRGHRSKKDRSLTLSHKCRNHNFCWEFILLAVGMSLDLENALEEDLSRVSSDDTAIRPFASPCTDRRDI